MMYAILNNVTKHEYSSLHSITCNYSEHINNVYKEDNVFCESQHFEVFVQFMPLLKHILMLRNKII